MKDYAAKGFIAGVTGDTTHQLLNKGIVKDNAGKTVGYDINKAITNYNPVQTIQTGITSSAVAPIGAKIVETTIIKFGPQSTWGNLDTLVKHFKDHQKDFNSKDVNDYTNKANKFYKNQNKYENFVGTDGNTRVYDSNNNTFGSYNPDGTTRTFFKPTSKNYWQNQINKWGVK